MPDFNSQERNNQFMRIVAPHIPEDSELASLDIINAITRNEVVIALGSRPRDNMIDAVDCLTTIYDELQKDEPDYNFIDEVVVELREYV